MIPDTAWSDAILAVVSGVLGLRLLNRGGGAGTAGVGLLLVGVAAAFGALRFSFAPSLALTHLGVSRLAAMVGLPLVGVGWVTAVWFPDRARQVRPYAFVLLLVAAVAMIAVEPYRTAVGGSGMAAALVASLWTLRRDPVAGLLGALGAVGVVVAGLAIAGEGSLGPLSRIAWVHLALAAANALLAAGLLRLPTRA